MQQAPYVFQYLPLNKQAILHTESISVRIHADAVAVAAAAAVVATTIFFFISRTY